MSVITKYSAPSKLLCHPQMFFSVMYIQFMFHSGSWGSICSLTDRVKCKTIIQSGTFIVAHHCMVREPTKPRVTPIIGEILRAPKSFFCYCLVKCNLFKLSPPFGCTSSARGMGSKSANQWVLPEAGKFSCIALSVHCRLYRLVCKMWPMARQESIIMCTRNDHGNIVMVNDSVSWPWS